MIEHKDIPLAPVLFEAECRELWRAVYAAATSRYSSDKPDETDPQYEADWAVRQYRDKYGSNY